MSFVLDAFFKILALIILHQLLSFYVQHAHAIPIEAVPPMFTPFEDLREAYITTDPISGQRQCCGLYGGSTICTILNGYEQCPIAAS